MIDFNNNSVFKLRIYLRDMCLAKLPGIYHIKAILNIKKSITAVILFNSHIKEW